MCFENLFLRPCANSRHIRTVNGPQKSLRQQGSSNQCFFCWNTQLGYVFLGIPNPVMFFLEYLIRLCFLGIPNLGMFFLEYLIWSCFSWKHISPKLSIFGHRQGGGPRGLMKKNLPRVVSNKLGPPCVNNYNIYLVFTILGKFM